MWLSPLSSPNGVWRVPNMLPSPMLPLLHLHHIWSSTSGPHLYSVVSKLGSLDALGGINTRTHCRFKSAQSHEVDPACREEPTKTVVEIRAYERNNFTFLQTKKKLFLHLFFFKFTNIPLDSNQDWKKLDSELERTFQQSPMEGKYFNIWLVFHNQLSSNCSCLDRPCPDPREKSHAQNNHLHKLRNQRWNSPHVVLIYLPVIDSDPFQIMSKQ